MAIIPLFIKNRKYYTKEGPGVSKNGPRKKQFVLLFEQYFSNIGKFIFASLLTSAFTLPVVTMGLGNVGITNIARNIYCGKHSFGVQDYLETVKKNWKQALPIGIINTVIMVLLVFNLYFYGSAIKESKDTFSCIALGVCIAFLATFSMMKYYIWVLSITFKYPLKTIYKNSFKFVFLNFPKSFVAGFCSIIAYAFAFLLFWYGEAIGIAIIAILAAVFWPGFKALLVQYCVFDSIKRIIIDPYYNEHPDEDIELRRSMGFLPYDEQESVFEDTV